MAQEQRFNQLKEFDVNALIASGSITSELEFQRASMADRSLRLLAEDNPALNVTRAALRELLIQYEAVHWSNADAVTNEQVVESDAAEDLAFAELKFVKRRREIILGKLREQGLKQKDLAALLLHSESYTSELLNGIRAFSTADLILIHKLFKIELKDLLITTLSDETREKVNATIERISSKNANVRRGELLLSNK